MNWSFHHLHLPFSDENRGLSLSPLVIDLARSFIRLLALFLVVFGVCVFPLIGWDSPVCDLRFSAEVCVSAFGFRGVFLVANIQSDYLQPLRLHLLIAWLNDLFRIQSTKRALKNRMAERFVPNSNNFHIMPGKSSSYRQLKIKYWLDFLFSNFNACKFF